MKRNKVYVGEEDGWSGQKETQYQLQYETRSQPWCISATEPEV